MSIDRSGGYCAVHNRNHNDGCLDCALDRLDVAVKIINSIYDNYGLSEHMQARIEEFMQPGEEDTTP